MVTTCMLSLYLPITVIISFELTSKLSNPMKSKSNYGINWVKNEWNWWSNWFAAQWDWFVCGESKRAVKEKNKSFSLFLFSFNYSHYCSHTLSQQRREERERVGFPLFLHSLIGVWAPAAIELPQKKTKEKQARVGLVEFVFVGGYGAEPICRREIPFHWFH